MQTFIIIVRQFIDLENDKDPGTSFFLEINAYVNHFFQDDMFIDYLSINL